MKGLDTLIAAVFIILISVIGIAIVLETSQPSVERLEEISLMEEGQNILTKIDNAVRDVAQQGEGSTRVLTISVSGGDYFIDIESETVKFSMDSISQIIGVGIFTSEGNINMFGELNEVLMNISFFNINITGGGSFGKGYHNLIIRNNGYDFANQKQIISISLVPPVLPPTALTVQFDQDGSPYIANGTNIGGIPDNLNDIGEGETYDIVESETTGSCSNVGSCGDCGDSATCSDCAAAGCAWFDASCAGACVCDGITPRGTCQCDNMGCSWFWVWCYGSCSCDQATTQGCCEAHGCTWNPASCTGNLDCSSLTETQCNDCSQCSWTPTTYRLEVWHNSTTINYEGTLISINVSMNFTTNVSDVYSLQIYDWVNSQWVSTGCDSGPVSAYTPTQWWCNENINPTNYISSDNIVRIRINSTTDSDPGLIKEDYIQYYANYIP